MFRHLTAGLLALSLGLAAPLPALADKDEGRGGTDLQRVLAGAALLGIVALAIRQHNRNEDDRHVPEPDPARLLPSTCLDIYTTRTGRIDIFDADCLDARYPQARHLPLDCAVATRVQGRFVSGYDAACLYRAGYEVSHRY